MALIKCPDCGRDVSDQATACPNCGHPIAGADFLRTPADPAPVQAQPAAEPAPEAEKPPLRIRFGLPMVAAILYSVYVIALIVFVRTHGLDQPEIFDNTFTAAFLGGAGSSMYISIVACALLWSAIGANRSKIYLAGMVCVTFAAVLWLMWFYFWLLPLILGWIAEARWHRAELTQ